VNEAHIRSDLQRVNNEAGRQKNKAGCCLYLFPPPYVQHSSRGCPVPDQSGALFPDQANSPANKNELAAKDPKNRSAAEPQPKKLNHGFHG